MFQNPLIQHFSVYKNKQETNGEYILKHFTNRTFLPETNHMQGFNGINMDRRGYGLYFSCWSDRWSSQNNLQQRYESGDQTSKFETFRTNSMNKDQDMLNRNTLISKNIKLNLNNNHKNMLNTHIHNINNNILNSHDINNAILNPQNPHNISMNPHNTHNITINPHNTHNKSCHNDSDECQKHDQALKPTQVRFNRRRSRTNFTDSQLEALEDTFRRHHYPAFSACERLSLQLHLSSPTIQIWFQNRRAKWRRQENTRRGPGRPSNNEARRSCSGEPIRGSQHQTLVKHENDSIGKIELGDCNDVDEMRKLEEYPTEIEFKYHHEDRSNIENDNVKRKEDYDNTRLSEGEECLQGMYKKKHRSPNFLPFNIENLLRK